MVIYHLTLLRSGPVAHPYHITAGLCGITLENGDEACPFYKVVDGKVMRK